MKTPSLINFTVIAPYGAVAMFSAFLIMNGVPLTQLPDDGLDTFRRGVKMAEKTFCIPESEKEKVLKLARDTVLSGPSTILMMS